MFEAITQNIKGLADSLQVTYMEHKPSILIYGGAIGLVIAGVAAVKAAFDTKKDLEKTKEDLDIIEEAGESAGVEEEVIKHDKAVVSRKAIGKIVVRWLAVAVLIFASFAAIRSGVNENASRFNELKYLAAVQSTQIDKILKRADEKFGPGAKEQLLYDIQKEEVEEKEVDPKTGKETVKKAERITPVDKVYDTCDGHRIVLNKQTCPTWFRENDPDYNFMELKVLENELNRMLSDRSLKFGAALMEASETMRILEYKPAEETEWRSKMRNFGHVTTKEHPCVISLGLKEARTLIELGMCTPDQIILHINFMRNIWKDS